MRRGTTQTLTFELDEDISNAKIFVSFEQNSKVVLEKTNDDITIDANTLVVVLSQADTLTFKEGIVKVQLRYIFEDGTASASDFSEFPVTRIAKDGEISWN